MSAIDSYHEGYDAAYEERAGLAHYVPRDETLDVEAWDMGFSQSQKEHDQ